MIYNKSNPIPLKHPVLFLPLQARLVPGLDTSRRHTLELLADEIADGARGWGALVVHVDSFFQ